MSKKRGGRSNASPRSQKREIAKKILEIVGASPQATLESLDLADAKRAELQQICRLLELRGTSRLRKAEIVDRIRDALQGRKAPGEQTKSAKGDGRKPANAKGAETSKSKSKSKPTPAPPVDAPSPEHGWSRAEFQARKFSLDEPVDASTRIPSPAPPPKYVPWSYGRPRVGALPVDPEHLFVYWEVTDEAVEEARQALGPGPTDAWLNLRVYDVTGRIFDGTNAHGYFDHGVGNDSRQWFFEVGKPGSDVFVEIGLRSRDGRFCKVARSGRVCFPRRGPAASREPQWLTVRDSGVEPVVAPGADRARLEPWAAGAVHHEPDSRESMEFEHDEHVAPSNEAFTRTVEFLEEQQIEKVWEGPVSTWRWESGPLSVPLDVPEPVWETSGGEARTFQVDGHTHIVYGPWQVVFRGGAYGGKRILSQWTVYRSWIVEGTVETLPAGAWERSNGGSALLGGSERRLRAASELRLSGASELLYRGASERRLGGASERVYAGASEKLMRGASERQFRGASERRLGGGSERWPSLTRRSTPDE